MKDPALLSTLEELLTLISGSFVRYCVESAETSCRDDLDRKAAALLQDWYRAGEQNRAAVRDLLAQEGHVPSTRSFPLYYSQYNFLEPGYLIEPAIRLMTRQLEEIRALAPRLEGWEQARGLVTAIIEREGPFLERARELAAERTSASEAPRVKGTSASRW